MPSSERPLAFRFLPPSASTFSLNLKGARSRTKHNQLQGAFGLVVDDPVVVSLKRKVRSLETNLLEWRHCACTVTTSESSCQLTLELSDEDVVLDDTECGDDVEEDGNDGSKDCDDDESRRGKCRVTIDLGSGLKRIEQKRKTKTRCEIEYCCSVAACSGSSSNSHADRRVVRTEELMASSAKHCQQFIDQVREAERQAKRKQSIRIGAVLAANAATLASASDSGGPSGHLSRGISSEVPLRGGAAGVRGSQISPPKIQTDRFRAPTATSFKSSSNTNTSNVVAADGILRASANSSSRKSEEIGPACVTTAASSAASVPGAPMPTAELPAPGMNGNSLLSASFSSTTSNHHRHEGVGPSKEQPKYNWNPSPRVACARDYESDTLDSSSGGISPRAQPNPPVGPRGPTNSTQNNIAGNSSLASSQVSSSNGSSTVSKALFLSSKPLLQEVFAKRLASLRMGTGGRSANQQLQQDSDDDDEEDDESFDNRRRARLEKLMCSPTNNNRSSSRTPRLSSLQSSRTSRRSNLAKRGSRDRSTTTSGKSTALLRRRNSGATVSVAALAANLNRLRLRERTHLHYSNNDFDGDGDDHDDGDDDGGDSDNRAELHILMRVEAALRQMEKENALAKEREALLAQEVQSLRDALCVKSAEKKHVETQFQQLLREKDEWKQVAHRAESAIAQIEDELLIAREEAQLLQSEKVRLKHQNKELMTHVHRLDSLVYGRF